MGEALKLWRPPRFSLSPMQLTAGAALSFFCAITMANTPYLFAGYGLTALALFTLGFLYSPPSALASFILGNSLGLAMVRVTDGIFTLVAVAAGLVRPIQLYILTRFKNKYGLAASSLLSLVVGIIIAIVLGVVYYGEGGLPTALSVFDGLYAVPAYLIYKFANAGLKRPANALGAVLALTGTVTAFISGSTFIAPLALIVALALLAGAFYIGRARPALTSKAVVLLSLIAVASAAAALYASQPAASYSLRSAFYAFYPDSLTRSQWIQKDASPWCRQGDLAGGRSVEHGVWDPERLRVISTCASITGTVRGIVTQSGPATDGDYLLDVEVDPQYRHMLSIGSLILKPGYIHVEVVPSDQPEVLKGLKIKPGDSVKVVGAFVVDTDHGFWSEIHPAWSIEVISKGGKASSNLDSHAPSASFTAIGLAVILAIGVRQLDSSRIAAYRLRRASLES